MSTKQPSIAVMGLGYVGLPLAVALARHFPVTGFDIKPDRIAELLNGFDRTGEIDAPHLRSSTLHCTSDAQELAHKDIYIVTVPTPVTSNNMPDLTPLKKASEMVGKYLTKGAIVVFESTVYPGVTEDYCGPILEKHSGLKAAHDFFLGYSPERINPGDREHTVDKITKVVSGQTPEVAEKLAHIYGTMNHGNIFVAANIKTAEAAKVIENAQRDINIAFINEITIITKKLGVSIYDVLDAAGTKWNFLKFKPGLVGGHCIGVDPYYLAYCARMLGHEPQAILAGRRINESMGTFIASAIHEAILRKCKVANKQCRILILGLTFKEDVPDIRNTKVIDIIHSLSNAGHQVEVHDPLADAHEALEHLDINLLSSIDGLSDYDCVVGAVAHQGYKDFSAETFNLLMPQGGLVADIKNIWHGLSLSKGIDYWTL